VSSSTDALQDVASVDDFLNIAFSPASNHIEAIQ